MEGLVAIRILSSRYLTTATFSLCSGILFFSIHGAIGYAGRTNGDEVPLGEKFYLGGIRTLRGFKTREVGPQDNTGEYIGGEKNGLF